MPQSNFYRIDNAAMQIGTVHEGCFILANYGWENRWYIGSFNHSRLNAFTDNLSERGVTFSVDGNMNLVCTTAGNFAVAIVII